ncbi:DUF3107 domain-containing protein [Allokutzneria oryzae]|uniref:DUF3107 domain-containing protein n=1 Tax=Allokutzneria oryzae TaxID=1378989 RepID=A0ABV6A2K1_9PSEU
MEVKIGVEYSPRELVISSALSQDEVEELVADSLRKDGGVLSLTDDKGKRFIIPASKVSYVEIGATDTRRVGFAVS